MKKSLMILAIAGSLFTINAAHARNVWRECGIGGMLFKKTGWAAIVSNIIWDLGTTATSSNVSSDDLCEGPTASTAKFINETYANLEEEVAAGEGKHVTAMLNMMGCSSHAQPAIIEGLRSDLNVQMSDASYSTQSKTQNAEIFFNSAVNRANAAKCSAI